MNDSTTTPVSNAGKRLRRARKRAGWTQGELALAASCSRATIARAESGTVTPSLSVATAIAAALAQTVESLFGPLASAESAALFKQVQADSLAALLLDADADDSVMVWTLPSSSLAAQEGMSATQFASERARALIALGSALEGLRSRGWSLDVQTRHDLAKQLVGVELVVTVEALHIPQHERSE